MLNYMVNAARPLFCESSVKRLDREALNGHAAKVIWFTGLSGAGKSTLANALEVELFQRGLRTFLLDGDAIRKGLCRDLGFSEVDRAENIRRISEVSKLMLDAGLIVLTATISPFKKDRKLAAMTIGVENFIEVYVDTPLYICEARDPKGLYQQARDGNLIGMTGVHSSYEAPDSPAYVAKAGTRTVREIVNDLMMLLET